MPDTMIILLLPYGSPTFNFSTSIWVKLGI
jgi:hypothetical protein